MRRKMSGLSHCHHLSGSGLLLNWEVPAVGCNVPLHSYSTKLCVPGTWRVPGANTSDSWIKSLSPVWHLRDINGRWQKRSEVKFRWEIGNYWLPPRLFHPDWRNLFSCTVLWWNCCIKASLRNSSLLFLWKGGSASHGLQTSLQLFTSL